MMHQMIASMTALESMELLMKLRSFAITKQVDQEDLHS